MEHTLISGNGIVDPDEIGWLHTLGGTPVGNYRFPIHRWFRFPAGFSSRFIDEIFNRFGRNLRDVPILDPCAGTATTLVCGKTAGLNCIGVEAHPLLYRIGKTKTCWDVDTVKLMSAAEYFVSQLRSSDIRLSYDDMYPPLVRKCFSRNVLGQLTVALNLVQAMKDSVEDSIYDFLWLAVLCILRQVSHAGTAPWQYILPDKRKENHRDVIPALQRQLNRMLEDLDYVQNYYAKSQGKSLLVHGDARNLAFLADRSIGFGVCSPPYLNNFDYSDATRLEMFVLKYASSWGEISRNVRTKLIVSATTQVRRSGFDPDEILKEIEPEIRKMILQPVMNLSEVRKDRGGKKNYDVMVAEYFADMMKVLEELTRVLINGSLFIMIVGDSAPYGVYIPTDEILANLALVAGFSERQVVKLRERNTRWDNRKHRVPLRESAVFLRR